MKQKSISSVLHMYGLGLDIPFYIVWVEENKVHKELVVFGGKCRERDYGV